MKLHVLLSRFSPRMTVLYLWMAAVSLPNLAQVLPWYTFLHMREVLTLLLAAMFFRLRSACRPAAEILLPIGIVIYQVFTVIRSGYDLDLSLKLLIRLTVFFLPVIVMPRFIRSADDCRSILRFALLMTGLLALTGPMQELTGSVNWAPSGVEGIEWQRGRAGFARYASIFGDPNIGGIIGGLIPLTILTWRSTESRRPRFLPFCLSLLVLATGALLVAFSLSFSGILTLLGSLTVLLFIQPRAFRHTLPVILILGVLAVTSIPVMHERLMGVVEFYTQRSSSGLAGAGETNLQGDLRFRFLSDLDLLHDPLTACFGVTYAVVVPNEYFNPQGILAHSGIKEILLAGGFVSFALYGLLFAATTVRAIRIFQWRHLVSVEDGEVAVATAAMFILLLALMPVFPVYHYGGVGLLLWTATALVHIMHNLMFRFPWVEHVTRTRSHLENICTTCPSLSQPQRPNI